MSAYLWPHTATRARRAPPDRPRRVHRRLRLEPLEDRCTPAANVVIEWNQVLLDTFKADRPAPLPAIRDLAIVHAAIYDAVNAIDRSYTPFFADVKASRGASLEAAAAQAAHDTLTALFPAHQGTYDATLAADLQGIPPGRARQGVAVGQAVAQQILDWRSTDGSSAQVPYTPGSGPGVWQPTPPAFAPAFAPQWGHVTPFAIPSGSMFRPPPPPALTSAEYTAAFNEVKNLGAAVGSTRTADQSQIAQFWYGTTPPGSAVGSVTPAGYWNQIAQDMSQRFGDSLVQDARLFALLNLSQADASIAVWDAKYTYNFWRPVTAIRAADTDGNPDTAPDPAWSSFLITPPHPSYISGHSGVSSASAAILADFFHRDAISFSFSSDSTPGVTRSFASFSAAAQEASDSRVYAGIHWRFDVQRGAVVGHSVGDYVFTHFLQRRSHDSGRDDDTAGDPPDGDVRSARANPGVHELSPDAGVPVTPRWTTDRSVSAPDAVVVRRPSESGQTSQSAALTGESGEGTAGALGDRTDSLWTDTLTGD